MFEEYKNREDLTVGQARKALGEILPGSGNCALAFDGGEKIGTICIVNMKLFTMVSALIQALADHGVPMDSMLSCMLAECGNIREEKELMTEFVKFRRLLGIELDEDGRFLKEGDPSIYLSSSKPQRNEVLH